MLKKPYNTQEILKELQDKIVTLKEHYLLYARYNIEEVLNEIFVTAKYYAISLHLHAIEREINLILLNGNSRNDEQILRVHSTYTRIMDKIIELETIAAKD